MRIRFLTSWPSVLTQTPSMIWMMSIRFAADCLSYSSSISSTITLILMLKL
ncbi:hypothetical protein [Paenibacillus sp. FSL H8-0548]|uniref:hypothetical protein n=1 Tax=Paenibacillus sp. FSL H8-0548 TaxID=1920422 RepID=UPI0015C3DB9F|nr:hypothetical protein [Paenibacillus sp. FSL H8-0548]